MLVISEEQMEASGTKGHRTRRMAGNEARQITSEGDLQAIIKDFDFYSVKWKVGGFSA